MEAEGSLMHLHVPATCPYSEPKYQPGSEALGVNIS